MKNKQQQKNRAYSKTKQHCWKQKYTQRDQYLPLSLPALMLTQINDGGTNLDFHWCLLDGLLGGTEDKYLWQQACCFLQDALDQCPFCLSMLRDCTTVKQTAFHCFIGFLSLVLICSCSHRGMGAGSGHANPLSTSVAAKVLCDALVYPSCMLLSGKQREINLLKDAEVFISMWNERESCNILCSGLHVYWYYVMLHFGFCSFCTACYSILVTDTRPTRTGTLVSACSSYMQAALPFQMTSSLVPAFVCIITDARGVFCMETGERGRGSCYFFVCYLRSRLCTVRFFSFLFSSPP